MNKEYLKEKIGVYKTLAALLWIGLFVLGGGLVYYLEKINTLVQKIVFVGGMVFEIFLFTMFVVFCFELRRLLKKLKGA